MNCNFSYSHYNELMKLIKQKNYKTIFFNQKDNDNSIIIRHDLDQSLTCAYEIAKIEAENDVKATYFLWLNSPFYNIFEKENKNIISEIIRMGHEIQLHFDETSYKIDNLNDLNKYINIEKNIIEQYFNVNISVVSFHRPSKYVLENNVDLGDLINTYSNDFFKEFKYISDSRGIWKEGCLCNLLEHNIYNKLQVLIHPIWWGNEPKKNIDKLDDFINFSVDKFKDNLSKNITIYKY